MPLSSPNPPDSIENVPTEFFSLAEEKFAGELSPEKNARLVEYLKNYPAAFDYYESLYLVDSRLPGVLKNSETSAGDVIRFSSRQLFAFAAAAVVAAAIAVPALFYLKNTSQPGLPVITQNTGREIPCRVTAAFGATIGGQRIDPQTPLAAETFAIETGIVELLFARGARLVVEGPAQIEIIDGNGCRLLHGKVVADVPPSARGFVVENRQDRIIDYGTRFAVSASPDSDRLFLGVLGGEVEIQHAKKSTRLFTDYAVERAGETLESVPLDRSKFITEMPSHEFPWALDNVPFDVSQTLRFDVTSLMKIPGENILVVFKWLVERDALKIEKVVLEHDDIPVLTSNKEGLAGTGPVTHDNCISFQLPAGTDTSGRWTVTALVSCQKTGQTNDVTGAKSRGIFMFEKRREHEIVADDFVGRWAYSHNDHDLVREFFPDGTWKIFRDGKEHFPPGGALPYTIEKDILTMHYADPALPAETITLRDKNTLIFLNRQYRNARRCE